MGKSETIYSSSTDNVGLGMTYDITLGDDCNYYTHDSYVINASVLQLIKTTSSDMTLGHILVRIQN
jgi:hypothetical protein